MATNIHSLFSLEGKVAIITGASRGLGKAIALAYGQAGAIVVATARQTELLDEVVAEIKEQGGEALTVKCDMAEDQDIYDLVKTTVDHYGRVDILVNNAGISPYVKFAVEVDREMWEQVLNINLIAQFILSREVGKLMLAQKSGHVINMASAGGLVGMPGQVAYAASKGALIQMTRTLAAEWASSQVTVNAIAPSILATDLTAGFRESEKHSKAVLQKIPMGYFGEPEDAVGAAIYLASDASRYVTGTVMLIDGGSLASW